MALSKIVAAGLVSMAIGSGAASAAELVVLSTTAAKESLFEIIPAFERASGHKVNFTFTNGPVMADRIRAGLTGDLFIGPDEYAEPLVKEGKLVTGSRVDFAYSGASVAVRSGAPKPDISTPEKFKIALLAVKTVSYSGGASGLEFVRGLERLGIANEVKAKRVELQQGETVGALVARGAAEIGIQQLSELLIVPGIEILGPLPGDLQRKIPYGAYALPGSTQKDAAKAFVDFLRSETAAAILKKKGMEPI